MTVTIESLRTEIAAFIEKYSVTDTMLQHNYEPEFNRLALLVFAHQYQTNPDYQAFAQKQHQTPDHLKNWHQIPVMPIKQIQAAGMNAAQSSQNGTIWVQALRATFKQFVMPDHGAMRLFTLVPGADHNPDIRLGRYADQIIKDFGASGSRQLASDGTLNEVALVQELDKAQNQSEPVLLFADTRAYLKLLTYLKAQNRRFHLPLGSRILNTGALDVLTQQQFYEALTRTFAIPRQQYVHLCGLHEASAQCYDQNIQTQAIGEKLRYCKKTPAWVKVQVLNQDTLNPAAADQNGRLAYYDLTNVDGCIGVLTNDLGYQNDNGFKLLRKIETVPS